MELHDALSTCVNVRVYGVSSVDRHGEYVFKNYISGLPLISQGNCIDEINKIIKEKAIDVIIPTHDDIVVFLCENKDRINAKIVNSDLKTALVCRDKAETYKVFSKYSFCPANYDNLNNLPVFIKPRKSQGSVGAKLIRNCEEVPGNISLEDYVICEYLGGEELTVDCFTDKNGNLQAIIPRSRQRTIAGVSSHSRIEPLSEEIAYIAQSINKELAFCGMWYFQVKKANDGNYKLLEISARCAGTMCMSRAVGVNMPLLSVYATMGYDTRVTQGSYSIEMDRMFISRYKTDIEYNTVYVDLDDTIIIDGKVHLPMLRFLYQCVNEGKRIVLVTRHSADHEDTVEEILRKHRISTDLFDEIKELSFDEKKYKVIDDTNSIFIDNAYAERSLVSKHLNIPVFDVDGIEILQDWRY